ncbi:MAG: DUF1385 domain-containing protein [Chloroflexi bacterium]|nr:DUF1385 domain-containing protein [Chloroflexota bacterium]
MHTKSISELLVALQRGDFSARELTSHFLDRINTLEPHYNSFITLLQEQALQSLTTRDPDEPQMEVALAALRAAIVLHQQA